MNKKILIIVIILAVGIIGFLLYFLLRSPGTPQQNPPTQQIETYSVSVTEQNSTISGTVLYGGQKYDLDATGLAQFATIGFNTTYETMWLMCPQGYQLLNQKSPSGNYLNSEEGLGISTNVSNTTASIVEFDCKKLSQ